MCRKGPLDIHSLARCSLSAMTAPVLLTLRRLDLCASFSRPARLLAPLALSLLQTGYLPHHCSRASASPARSNCVLSSASVGASSDGSLLRMRFFLTFSTRGEVARDSGVAGALFSVDDGRTGPRGSSPSPAPASLPSPAAPAPQESSPPAAFGPWPAEGCRCLDGTSSIADQQGPPERRGRRRGPGSRPPARWPCMPCCLESAPWSHATQSSPLILVCLGSHIFAQATAQPSNVQCHHPLCCGYQVLSSLSGPLSSSPS